MAPCFLFFFFLFCGGLTDLDFRGLEKTLNVANEEFAQNKKRTEDIFLMISSLLVSTIYRAFLIAGLTFSTCLHRYRCKICNLVRRTLENCSCLDADLCLELYWKTWASARLQAFMWLPNACGASLKHIFEQAGVINIRWDTRFFVRS